MFLFSITGVYQTVIFIKLLNYSSYHFNILIKLLVPLISSFKFNKFSNSHKAFLLAYLTIRSIKISIKFFIELLINII